MPLEVLQHRACEVPHVQKRLIRQGVLAPHDALRGRTGAAGDMRVPQGDCDVDTHANAVDPRRTGGGDDDPRGAQDRQSPHNAQTRVPCLASQLLAVVDRDLNGNVRRSTMV